MKVVGIIAEYNPFHLGHLYQINMIKEMYPNSIIIAVVSTHFTQRGDISVLNKWDKARICLENNVDIVLELPTLYATQSSDIFAEAALKILNSFNIDALVFGSESNDIDMLKKMAMVQLKDDRYNDVVKKYLNLGVNYPTAMSKALMEISNDTVINPNDLLGLSYVKEIIRNNYDIEPVSIKRSNDYHAQTVTGNIISANLIRKMLYDNKDVSIHIPKITNKYLYRDVSLDKAFNLLKYSIINNIDSLNKYLTVDEGIENRIIKYINDADCWEDLVMKIKTKRYTYNKVNRMLMHILLGIKKEDNTKEIYLRVLGFSHKGRKYLNTLKKEVTLPIYVGYKKDLSKIFDIEFRASCIYSLITSDVSICKNEYKKMPIMKY